MKTLRAKFSVTSVTNFPDQSQAVNLHAVTSGSEENKSFSKYTPWGELKINITNPDAINFFKPGDEIYLNFSRQADE